MAEKGVILAIHCVPMDVDPNIAAFWERATKQLAKRGFVLAIASTTGPIGEHAYTFDLPFNLPDFAYRFAHRADHSAGRCVFAQVEQCMNWYRCSTEMAVICLSIAGSYYRELIEALRPAAVIGWQSMHPGTKLLFDAANAIDIPVWSAERGWITDTLMIDLGQNNVLSEIHRSFAIGKFFEHYEFDARTYALLEKRRLGTKRVGRYSSSDFVTKARFGAQLGIAEHAKIVAFFMHGEPAMHMNPASALSDLHGTSKVALQRQIDAISHYCIERGMYLLIQHHPFNKEQGYTLTLVDSPYVKEVSVNIHTLLNAADRYLFTFSTIQYDAVFQRKPFGLLSRSSLDVQSGAYRLDDFASIDAFMDALSGARDWEVRLRNLQRFLLFIHENFLLDISPEHIEKSAERFATQLSKFERHVDKNLAERIASFKTKWRF